MKNEGRAIRIERWDRKGRERNEYTEIREEEKRDMNTEMGKARKGEI